MWFVRFMRSMPGRVLWVALGLWLIVYGATHASLFGLVLMMAGMVPAVTGLADISLIEEVIKSRRTRNLPAGRPREHSASR
jgi:hypothetical protein